MISFASRIALLEAEERKAWKKIHQTKERATNVIQVREEAKLRKREQQVARKTDERRAREEVESRYLAKEMERQAKKVRGLEGAGVHARVCVCVEGKVGNGRECPIFGYARRSAGGWVVGGGAPDARLRGAVRGV